MSHRSARVWLVSALALVSSGCATDIVVPMYPISVPGPTTQYSVELNVPETSRTYVATAQAGFAALTVKFGEQFERVALNSLRGTFREVYTGGGGAGIPSSADLVFIIEIERATVSPGFTVLSSSSALVQLKAIVEWKNPPKKARFSGAGEATVSPKIDLPLTANDRNYFNAIRQASGQAMQSALQDLLNSIMSAF